MTTTTDKSYGERIWSYILSQLDKTTAWVGLIGIVLYCIHLHTLLIALFVALIILPEGNFSAAFKKMTAGLRSID